MIGGLLLTMFIVPISEIELFLLPTIAVVSFSILSIELVPIIIQPLVLNLSTELYGGMVFLLLIEENAGKPEKPPLDLNPITETQEME